MPKENPQKRGAIWRTSVAIGTLDKPIVLELPVGSTLLDVGDKGGAGIGLDFWFFVPDTRQKETEVRRVFAHPTGHPLDLKQWCPDDYWKTVITAGGALVLHIFLEGKK